MKIYTRAGDDGDTGLFGGGRVGKDDPRIAACGAVDELNATLGVAVAALRLAAWDAAPLVEALLAVQHQLFALGAELASSDAASQGTQMLCEAHVERLEGLIDRFEEGLPPLTQFILPGGAPEAAALHLARCVCRRAERSVVEASRVAAQRPTPLKLLNRLGDLLFVAARVANHRSGQGDEPWDKGA